MHLTRQPIPVRIDSSYITAGTSRTGCVPIAMQIVSIVSLQIARLVSYWNTGNSRAVFKNVHIEGICYLKYLVICICENNISASRCISYVAGQAEEALCEYTPLSTFRKILKALIIEWRNSTLRFSSIPEGKNKNI